MCASYWRLVWRITIILLSMQISVTYSFTLVTAFSEFLMCPFWQRAVLYFSVPTFWLGSKNCYELLNIFSLLLWMPYWAFSKLLSYHTSHCQVASQTWWWLWIYFVFNDTTIFERAGRASREFSSHTGKEPSRVILAEGNLVYRTNSFQELCWANWNIIFFSFGSVNAKEMLAKFSL